MFHNICKIHHLKLLRYLPNGTHHCPFSLTAILLHNCLYCQHTFGSLQSLITRTPFFLFQVSCVNENGQVEICILGSLHLGKYHSSYFINILVQLCYISYELPKCQELSIKIGQTKVRNRVCFCHYSLVWIVQGISSIRVASFG